MLALRLLSLQAQTVIKAHKFVDISWSESSTGFADDESRLRCTHDWKLIVINGLTR